MTFQIKRIFRNTTNDKRPVTVEFTVPPDTPAEGVVCPAKRFYSVDLTGKCLRAFKHFRAFVAEEFGVWLSAPVKGYKTWDQLVAAGFEKGRIEGASDEHLSRDKLMEFAERRRANAQQILDAADNLAHMSDEALSFLVGPVDVSLAEP